MTYIVEYTSFSGKSIPMMHAVFESADAANTHAVKNVTNGNYRSYALKQINEGYKILPPISDKYQSRSGLEGPFSTLSGKVVYYDPKEGKYYDPDTDTYMSYDEFQNYDKDYSDMKDERDEVKESVDALRQIVTDKNSAKVNGTLVDLFTASAIMQVYDAVNDANKEKMDSMLKTKAGLMKIANFAMTKVESATNEGKSPHKKGTAKYKKHMAAMHAEDVDHVAEGFKIRDKSRGYGVSDKTYKTRKEAQDAAIMKQASSGGEWEVIEEMDETAYGDARLATIQTDRTNRLNQIQQNRDDRKAELKTSRDARSVKNRAALDSLKETLSPEEKKLVSKMYNKDGTLTALGKKVMDHGKTNEVTEGVADEAVHMERDHEVQMARSDLYKIANYAVKLHKMLKNVSEEQGIQGWMQAKITKAADYMSSVAHTLEYDIEYDMMGKHQSEPMAEAMDASKYHCEDCGCQMHNCKPECDCSHDSHDETGSWWKDADGNGVPDAFESVEEMTSAGGMATVAAPMGKTKKPQQNLMAKTKALGKITKALNKKK
jgi:hypothetical protein